MGDYEFRLTVTDSHGAESDPDTVRISTYNTAPVAEAGPDQALLLTGTLVQLDGTQSYDDDGDVLMYAWTMTQKPEASDAYVIGPASPSPQFIADVNGTYVIGLTVTDTFGATGSDTVTVSFNNIAPVADAGVNQAVDTGTAVTLDGSGSSDANNDPLTYQWGIVSKPDGSSAALSSTTSAQTGFTADLAGDYMVSLVVNDGITDSEPSNLTVTATSSRSTITQIVQQAVASINLLEPGVFKNGNMQNALTSKLSSVLEMLDAGLYAEALDKLQNDVLKKTDGCAESGGPDKNDWINECASQDEVYPVLIEAIDMLQTMIGG